MITKLWSNLPVNIYRYNHGLYQQANGNWTLVENSDELCEKRSKRVCLLSRQHYVETQKEYPVKNIYHLFKMIKAEARTIAPFEGHTFWAITKAEVGNWQVSYWSVSSDTHNLLKESFRYVLPESYLLRKAIEHDTLYDIEGIDGLYSLWLNNKFYSAAKDSLIYSPQRFLQVVNALNHQSESKKLDTKAYYDLLDSQARNAQFYLSPGLILKRESVKRDFDWKQWKIPFMAGGVAMLAYAVIASFYLESQLDQLDKTIGEQRREMSQLIKLESQEKALSARLGGYDHIYKNYPGIAKVLSLLNNDKLDSLTVTNFELNGRQVILRGLAIQATPVFEALSSQALVSNIDFTSPITKTREGLERFELTFNIHLPEVGSEQ